MAEIKKLKTATLADALAEMEVGESRYAPDGYSAYTVRKTCTEMKERGYIFQTSLKTGVQTVTRLK